MDDLGAKRLHDHPRSAETAKPEPRKPDTAKPWGLLLLLMAVTSIGPTTLNIVVPALPQMANRLASDVAILSPTELKWLNDYHTRVNREVRPHLDDTATKLWLDEATAALLVL